MKRIICGAVCLQHAGGCAQLCCAVLPVLVWWAVPARERREWGGGGDLEGARQDDPGCGWLNSIWVRTLFQCSVKHSTRDVTRLKLAFI